MKDKKGALDGFRILDMTFTAAGLYCTMLLGDMGAEIIKIEVPGNGDDSRKYPYFMNLNRNKKSLTLNLKATEGKKILLNLVKLSDVLVESFKPGTLEALGLGYDKLKTVNRDLVYSSVPGFGTGGPDNSSFDPAGEIEDILAGLCACVGILTSLIAVGNSRRGQKVNIALTASAGASEAGQPAAGKMKLISSSIHLSETPVEIRSAAPLLGQHSAEILRSVLNYSPEHIEALKRDKVI